MSEGLPPGWETSVLDNIAEVRLGRQRSPKNHIGSNMRPYLRAANVTWAGVNLTDVKEMNFTEEECKVYELHDGDVLVAEASGSQDEVGKTALWRGQLDRVCFQNTLIRVRSFGVDSGYLARYLEYEALSGALGRAARGVGIHHLGSTTLSAWTVPVPPLAEQKRIVEALDEAASLLDAGKSGLEANRKRLSASRDSVLRSAITGALVGASGTKSDTEALLRQCAEHRSAKLRAAPIAADVEGLPEVSDALVVDQSGRPRRSRRWRHEGLEAAGRPARSSRCLTSAWRTSNGAGWTCPR